MEHGRSRLRARRPTKNDPKLRKIFEKFWGLAKLNKKEEQGVMKILETQGKLSDLDFAFIRAYSLAFQEWNEAELLLQK